LDCRGANVDCRGANLDCKGANLDCRDENVDCRGANAAFVRAIVVRMGAKEPRGAANVVCSGPNAVQRMKKTRGAYVKRPPRAENRCRAADRPAILSRSTPVYPRERDRRIPNG
jgi:hypothetical protein